MVRVSVLAMHMLFLIGLDGMDIGVDAQSVKAMWLLVAVAC